MICRISHLASGNRGDSFPSMRAIRQMRDRMRRLVALPVAFVASLCLALVLMTATVLAQASRGPHYNSIAVIIGNQNYRLTTPVIYARNDALAMQKYLIERLGFRKSNIILLTDVGREQMETIFGEPDRADGQMMDLIAQRRQELRGDVFVFYSGHGVPDPDAVQDDARRAFLLPVDVGPARITQAAFPIDRLYKKLEIVRGQLPPDRNVVVMLDACFSGRTPVARGGGSGPDASIFSFSRGSFSVRADESAAGVVRLVAATGDQVAYWDEPRKLGLFTSLFLRAVGGEADGPEFGNGDRIITGDELGRFLEERVPAEARLRHQRTQWPTLDGLSRFAWTLPRPGQVALPAVVPGAARPLPAALPAAVAPAVPAVAAPVISAPATAPPAVAPSAPVAAPVTVPPAVVVPAAPPAAKPAPAVAARPEPKPAVAPPPAAPKPVAVPAPQPRQAPARTARPAADDEDVKPAPRPRRQARAVPRPVVEEDDEPVRPRVRPRPRPIAEPPPRPRPPARAAQPAAPREPAGGGCRVVNGVRFCG